MIFDNVINEVKKGLKKMKPEEEVKAKKGSDVISDPKKYPKKDMYAWDTGIADRSPAGFTSDVNVLKHKEIMGKVKK